jgi:hypothetical protein
MNIDYLLYMNMNYFQVQEDLFCRYHEYNNLQLNLIYVLYMNIEYLLYMNMNFFQVQEDLFCRYHGYNNLQSADSGGHEPGIFLTNTVNSC